MENFGESHVRYLLKQLAKEQEGLAGCVLNNVYLTAPDGSGSPITWEYDHILVTQYGVIVIETKNWSGKTYLTQNVGVLSGTLSNRYFLWTEQESKNPQAWYLFNLKRQSTGENSAGSVILNPYAQDEGNHLANLRRKSSQLKYFLNISHPKLSYVLNRMVFIVDKKKRLIIDGDETSKQFGDFTKVVRSGELIADLKGVFTNTKGNRLAEEDRKAIQALLSGYAKSVDSY